MSLNIPEEKNINAVISADEDVVYFAGEIDSADPGLYLTSFFTKIIENMSSCIMLDVSNLEFINSSGIKCFVSFILERTADTKVTFLIDNSKSWQLKTLEVLQSLDEDNIEILEK